MVTLKYMASLNQGLALVNKKDLDKRFVSRCCTIFHLENRDNLVIDVSYFFFDEKKKRWAFCFKVSPKELLKAVSIVSDLDYEYSTFIESGIGAFIYVYEPLKQQEEIEIFCNHPLD